MISAKLDRDALTRVLSGKKASFCDNGIEIEVSLGDDLSVSDVLQLVNQVYRPHVTVHIVSEGYPLCGALLGPLQLWPVNHRWVHLDDWQLATCPRCLERLRQK